LTLIESTKTFDTSGSGLPATELWIARVLFFLFRLKTSDSSALSHFIAEHEKILTTFDNIPSTNQTTRVLIGRIQGIENSSRNWSAALTLEHLAIVNTGILRVIQSLENRAPIPEVRIADVKPKHNDSAKALEEFTASVRQYTDFINNTNLAKVQSRHRHPWFGMLSAHGWHCLAAVHHTIHKNQLRLIAARLKE
jgi:uncharacterized damage-inducible protein DinB